MNGDNKKTVLVLAVAFWAAMPQGSSAAGVTPSVSAAASASDVAWAQEAAAMLRGELEQAGIHAAVEVVSLRRWGKLLLVVDFQSGQDYEEIRDIFYQDPGDNPSYRGIKVWPRFPRG